MSAPTAKKRVKKAAAPAVRAEDDVDIEALAVSLTDVGPIGPDGEVRPVQIGKRGRPGVEMVHIFSLDDTDYFIPKKPNRLLLVGYLRSMKKARTQDEQDAATLDLLLSLLGKNAVDALQNSPLTTDDDVADVLTIVTKIAFAAIADLKGLASGN